jgi:hypothetical protein
MRAFCKTVDEGRATSLSFSHTHMYESLGKYIDCSLDTLYKDTTHYLILDIDGSLNNQIDFIKRIRNQGVKVILMAFDPAKFGIIDYYIQNEMLDKLILFDNQFKDRFRIPTYISDYFFNEDVFPGDEDYYSGGIYPNEVCVFGHLLYGRNNDFNLRKIDDDPGVEEYRDLYFKVKTHNGVAVYATGLSEDRSSIVHYNKAKAVETLMCGRNPYCKDGIKTKRYDRFLKKYGDIPNPKEIDFTQEEIFQINDLTIRELVYELKYI